MQRSTESEMLLRIHPDNPGERQMKPILDCLRNGGVIIYPTDTVYAMGCDATQIRAVERVARIKGVRLEKADFSLICSSLSQLSDYTRPISNHTFRIIRRALPGPYTFILNANSNVPRFFQNKKKTVGIRIPAHPVPVTLVERLGNPIMTTSLHHEDEIVDYLTDPEEIYERFSRLVDVVIDSGHCGLVPSTVVDCTGDEPVVVREGLGDTEIIS